MNDGIEGSQVPEYKIEFVKRKQLPSAGSQDAYSDTEEGATILEEETKWQAKLDHADKIDCLAAAASGLIAGAIDSFFVGKFSFEKANTWGSDQVEDFVKTVAKKAGYKGDALGDAIEYLEKRYKMAADGAINEFGGGKQHHLRDFSHHFSIGGLACSIFTQFSGKIIGTDTAGNLLIVDVSDSYKELLGSNIYEKILFGTLNWMFHIASDMAGSSGFAGKGTGVPGPIISLIKMLSALPIFKDSSQDEMSFRKFVSKLFNGTFLKTEDGQPLRFDLRTEIGMVEEFSRQAIPVIINQCLIRTFYFVRRFIYEIQALEITSISELNKIDPKDVLPFKNPAIGRMSTIASGVFSVIDLADAGVRALIVVAAEKDLSFIEEFVVRINFVGVGVLAVAVTLDAKQVIAEFKENNKDDAAKVYERDLSRISSLELNSEQIRILQSIQRDLVVRDIKLTKQTRRKEAKQNWLDQWEDAISKGLKSIAVNPVDYFLNTSQIYERINTMAKEDTSKPWPYLLALEADLAQPYQPLGGDDDKSFKGLKAEDDYMTAVFAIYQDVVSVEDIRSIRKSLKQAQNEISAQRAKSIIGVAGAVAITVASAGAAFVFAPLIAPIIAGEAVAGLSGAALTSASLAFVGGGALAAGGAGMAGGTAIIAGGGALLGAAGGSSASALASLTSGGDGYVFAEASKLVCFCREVLLERYNDIDAVTSIQKQLNEKIFSYEIELESLKQGGAIPVIINETDSGNKSKRKQDEKELNPKKQQKILEKSLKYLKRCNDALSKSLKKQK